MNRGVGANDLPGRHTRAAGKSSEALSVNFLGELWDTCQLINKDRMLLLAVAGNTYFWFLGALLQQTILVYSPQDVLKIDVAHQLSASDPGVGHRNRQRSGGISLRRKNQYGLVPLRSSGSRC